MFFFVIHLYPLNYKLCLNKDLIYLLSHCLFSIVVKSGQQDGLAGKDSCYQV